MDDEQVGKDAADGQDAKRAEPLDMEPLDERLDEPATRDELKRHFRITEQLIAQFDRSLDCPGCEHTLMFPGDHMADNEACRTRFREWLLARPHPEWGSNATSRHPHISGEHAFSFHLGLGTRNQIDLACTVNVSSMEPTGAGSMCVSQSSSVLRDCQNETEHLFF